MPLSAPATTFPRLPTVCSTHFRSFDKTLAEFAKNTPAKDEQVSSEDERRAKLEEEEKRQKYGEVWATMDEILGQ